MNQLSSWLNLILDQKVGNHMFENKLLFSIKNWIDNTILTKNSPGNAISSVISITSKFCHYHFVESPYRTPSPTNISE